jgi:hypothetical protein
VTVTISDIYLKETSSGKLVTAELHDSIQQRHLDHHDQHWKPVTTKLKEQQGHWDWQEKWTHYSNQLCFQSFAIECNGETQGMMIVNTIHTLSDNPASEQTPRVCRIFGSCSMEPANRNENTEIQTRRHGLDCSGNSIESR